MKVINKLGSAESKTETELIVENVWNKEKCVQIQIGKETIIVYAEELKKAIDNATENERCISAKNYVC